MKNIAVVGAGIVGICCAYFLKKSGLSVTLIDREDPGTMTSFGHACSFADYANAVSYTHLRAHETREDIVFRLLH